jgi:PTS system cellobiose-specific IIA component
LIDEQTMLHLLLHAGNARRHAYEALNLAEASRFAEADEAIREAEEEWGAGHRIQTDLLLQAPSPLPLLLIHAQDHLMAAQTELELIKRLIRQQRRLHALEKRLEQSEKKGGNCHD